MIDPSLMPELPVMPNPKLYPSGTYPDGVLTYSADQMNAYATAYGLQCYQLAMERAAQEVEGDRPVTKEAGGRVEIGGGARRAIAAAIRALALQEKTT